ncbi:MAG: hypothetical protein ACPG6B_00770 [Oceanihabitans sp.]
MINVIKHKNKKTAFFGFPFTLLFIFAFLFLPITVLAQVTSSIDSTSVKIGEQITYQIQVKTDSTNLVVFPEGQTFSPLEVIESYKIDTTKSDAKFQLIKKYGLTQFDSGSYTIPRQKIVVGTSTFFTDSLQVFIKNIKVDTTKQGLYDIKPFIKVEKSSSNFWSYFLLSLLLISIIGFLLYWFIWRKKPLTKEEEIALLPPYDRAKLALQKLDETNYLENAELKDYYSELTFIIRKYLDEKVYDHALESTTDELINRLNLLKDGNQIDISKDDIKNIETILKRADLVKFAKSAPDVELAKLDRNTVDVEIDQVKEALPEPTEEEKLQNKLYQEEQERKQKRKKTIFTVAIIAFLLVATFIGFGAKYGFNYVKDTIIGHESKELLEGDWITSAYGIPPIYITTPKVLKRLELQAANQEQAKIKSTTFNHATLLDAFSIMVNTTVYPTQEPPSAEDNATSKQPQIDLQQASEAGIKSMEAKGISNIVVKTEQFITPNAAEGLKTYGTMQIPVANTKQFKDANYVLLQFTAENILQQILITWEQNDSYANQMVTRILESVELKKEEE